VAAIRKRRSKPFGGLQLIVSGDFFQLGPVVKSPSKQEEASCARAVAAGRPGAALFCNRGLAFEAPAWARCGFETVLLSKAR